MDILPVQGYKSLRALNAFNMLLMGLKMLPGYMHMTYPVFFETFKEKTDEEKLQLVKQAVLFVELGKDEVEALLSFTKDSNGIAMSAINIGSLKPDEIVERLVAVCMHMGSFKIDLLTEAEKKKFQNGQSILEGHTVSTPTEV